MRRPEEIANYFLARQKPGDEISNLKLQKLLYYAYGYFLVRANTYLFGESLERWPHGPVVKSIYHQYKQFDRRPIPYTPRGDESVGMKPIEIEVLDEVYATFGRIDAKTLSEMTHREPPWLNTPDGAAIRNDMLRAFFTTLLSQQDEEHVVMRVLTGENLAYFEDAIGQQEPSDGEISRAAKYYERTILRADGVRLYRQSRCS